ncbi:MAG TPA: DUF4388 domain-containing protein, partial [Planctomycetota bacterium]|nr:DUF4388 domain-containing protein [Planctomycetota bacterium]
MQGSLASVALPEVLQMLASARRTGTLHVASPADARRFDIRGGRLVWGALPGGPRAADEVAAHFDAVLSWKSGGFVFGDVPELEPPPAREEDRSLAVMPL